MTEKLSYDFVLNGSFSPVIKALDLLDQLEAKVVKISTTKLDFTLGLKAAHGLEAFNNSIQQSAAMLSGVVMQTAALSDAMAIAHKNTGLTDAEMRQLRQTIDAMNTRTATADLLAMASVGGKLGVPRRELAGFVQVIDRATVALGDEFGNSAERVAVVLGKIKGQYREFANLSFAEALQGIGSGINYLGKQGANSAPNVAEFAQRVSTMGLRLSEAAGMGAALEELGMSAELASGGLRSILGVAKTESAAFAAHLRMPVKAFESLLNKDPNAMLLRLAHSFKGASQTQIAQTLDRLKIGSQESQQAMMLLADQTDLVRLRQIQFAYAQKQKNDLDQEAAVMNNTLAAQIAKTQKQFDAYVLGLGASFAPYMNVIQATTFLSTGLAALIPLLSLAGNVLLAGVQGLLRYGLGLTVVNGQLAFTQASLLGLIARTLQWAAVMAVQGAGAAALFAGRLVLLASVALPALISTLGGASLAASIFNAVMSINPFVVGMIGAAALIGLLVGLVSGFGGVMKAVQGVWNFVLRYNPFSLLAQGMDALFGTKMWGRACRAGTRLSRAG